MVLNGTWAASFTSLVTDALGASNRHMQRDSLGRKVLRMRRTAYHHPEGSRYIERFHRSLGDRTPWEAFQGFESDLRIEALSV